MQLLEKFVNSPIFNVDYVLQLGDSDLKKVIQHLGMGDKNTSDIILMFEQIKNIWKNVDTFLVRSWNSCNTMEFEPKLHLLYCTLHMGRMM